jgi:hypothetical protein
MSMRKLLVPFLLTTLAAALFAYLNNAYQKHKREEVRQEQVEIERQQHQQFERAHGADSRAPLGRGSRDRPER